jgi:hypothetical protein
MTLVIAANLRDEAMMSGEGTIVLRQWRASGKSAQAYGVGTESTRNLYIHGMPLGGRGAPRFEVDAARGDGGFLPAVVRVASGGEHSVAMRLPNGLVLEEDAARVSAKWLRA